ncbi:hypothetical protein OAG34_00850 [bacterium]|jgi:hypothetical protein|nr:hypothetical protein [bacterium]
MTFAAARLSWSFCQVLASDPCCEEERTLLDVFSLKLAIYFVAPIVVLYVSAYIFAGVFTLIARIIIDRDVSHGTALDAMAFVIATTAAVIGLAYYTTQVLWVAIAAGSASFFFVGAIRYSRLFNDSSKHGRKGASTAVGLWKGFLISAILSSVLLGITILVVLTVGIAL